VQRLLELGKTQHGISGKSTGGAGSRDRLASPGKLNLNGSDWRGRLTGPGKLNLIGSDWWKRYQAGRITAGLLYLDGCDKVDFRGASMI
jgi:hypothetical protein